MINYFEEFFQRFDELKKALEKKVGDLTVTDNLKAAVAESHQDLNNLIMAGLGMGTLYLRMGAVLMIADKTKSVEDEADVSFLKVVAEKLIHKLPNDGEWKDIWNMYLSQNRSDKWYEMVDRIPKIPGTQEKKIYELFVSFRNDIAHQEIIIKPELSTAQIEEISIGIKILEGMAQFVSHFEGSSITEADGKVFFRYKDEKEGIVVSPYVQLNKEKRSEALGILPYLFQGKYYKGSKFINTEGGETREEIDDAIEETFSKIKEGILRYNGDKAFDFKEKIDAYNEWCIGREEVVNAILDWINNSETDKNVLPIFAPAGMGKGALIAEVIKELKGKQPMMFHFCGSGKTNNLHSVLYHFILQGKNMPGLNGVSIWESNDEKINSRLQKFPLQYVDTITLFQNLLSNCISLPQSHKGKALVIILDGLDEAAVADHSKRISDWFYTYDDKGERKEKWTSPEHIKWIFTYRQTSRENKEGFQFEYHEFNSLDLPDLQPLNGLTKEAVKKGLQEEFKTIEPALSAEFIDTIIKKGAVK